MNKSKTPVLLATIVGTLVLALVAINMSQYLRRPGGLQEIKMPNEEALMEASQRKDHASGTDESMVSPMKQASGFEPDMAPGAGIEEGIPDEPSIQIPSVRRYQPEFQADTTSSHWYEDDSYQNVNAKKKQGTRVESDSN